MRSLLALQRTTQVAAGRRKCRPLQLLKQSPHKKIPPDVFIDEFNIPDGGSSIVIRSLSRQHSERQESIVLG